MARSEILRNRAIETYVMILTYADNLMVRYKFSSPRNHRAKRYNVC